MNPKHQLWMAPALVGALYYAVEVFRNALAPSARPFDGLGIALIGLLVLALGAKIKVGRTWRLLWWLGAVLLLTVVGAKEARFRWAKHQVLNGSDESLRRAGRHFVIGFRDESLVRLLSRKGAIAGLYIARHNVDLPDAEHLRTFLQELQSTRMSAGLDPLVITTDQEGGMVTRLSPPLPRGEGLRAFAKASVEDVEAHGFAQGQALAELGITMNFSPVVDLDHGLDNPDDKFSRIGERAISNDSDDVVRVAEAYCHGLARANVQCVLKHFPGLGTVFEDTHRVAAAPARFDLLADSGVFASLMKKGVGATMLSHATSTPLDPNLPSSVSHAVVSTIRQWAPDQILVTDDLSMFPISRGVGIERATELALRAGVDLLLISYDYDLFFRAMTQAMSFSFPKVTDEPETGLQD